MRRLALIDRESSAAGKLPYEDGRFDFVVCAGVAERLADPRGLLEEIGRTGRAGYLECRRGMAQIFQPDPTVRWLADHECDTLFFRACDQTEIDMMGPLRRRMELQVPIARSIERACASARLRPLFFIELRWSGRVRYRILRNDGDPVHVARM